MPLARRSNEARLDDALTLHQRRDLGRTKPSAAENLPELGLRPYSGLAASEQQEQVEYFREIEAVTRRLAKILKLPLDLAQLRTVSTEWELQVSSAIEKNKALAEKVRQMEEEYDNELLEREEDT